MIEVTKPFVEYDNDAICHGTGGPGIVIDLHDTIQLQQAKNTMIKEDWNVPS